MNLGSTPVDRVLLLNAIIISYSSLGYSFHRRKANKINAPPVTYNQMDNIGLIHITKHLPLYNYLPNDLTVQDFFNAPVYSCVFYNLFCRLRLLGVSFNRIGMYTHFSYTYYG